MVPFHYVKESIRSFIHVIYCTPVAWKVAPEIRRGEEWGRKGWFFWWFFFLLFFSPIPHHTVLFPEKLDWELALSQVRVLTVNMKYLHFAASTVFQALAKKTTCILWQSLIAWVEYVAKLFRIFRTRIPFKELKGFLEVKNGKAKSSCPP